MLLIVFLYSFLQWAFLVYVTLLALWFSALFPSKYMLQILAPTTPIGKKKFQGTMPTTHFLALISFMHEKWVGLNILGLSALIFSALVTPIDDVFRFFFPKTGSAPCRVENNEFWMFSYLASLIKKIFCYFSTSTILNE